MIVTGIRIIGARVPGAAIVSFDLNLFILLVDRLWAGDGGLGAPTEGEEPGHEGDEEGAAVGRRTETVHK